MSCSIESSSRVAVWTADQIGCQFSVAYTGIGLIRDGRIEAGVVYENFNGASIMCHVAFSGRLTPQYLYAIFHYPFVVCAARKIIGPVASTNTAILRLLENMGFEQEAKLVAAHPKGDILIMTMERTRCRFIGERYGKRVNTTTTSAKLSGIGRDTKHG